MKLPDIPTADTFSTMLLSGASAAARAAYALSETIIVYTFGSDSLDETFAGLHDLEASAMENIYGSTTRVVRVDTMESNTGSVILGAIAEGSVTSVVVSSHVLPLFIPVLHEIGHQQRGCVVHVEASCINEQDLSTVSGNACLYDMISTRCSILNSSTVQECHDMSIVASAVAKQTAQTVLHFFDGTHTSRLMTKVSIPKDYASLNKSSVEYNTPSPHTVSAFANKMNQVAAPTKTKYAPFEYHGSETAKTIVVTIGEISQPLILAAKHYALTGREVGVIQVRLCRPWSTRSFLEAVPPTVAKVAIIEREDAECVSLLEDVRATFHTYANQWKLSYKSGVPAVTSAVLTNPFVLKPSTAWSLFDHLAVSTENTTFYIPDADDLVPDLNTIPRKSLAFWSSGDTGDVRAVHHGVSQVLGCIPDIRLKGRLETDMYTNAQRKLNGRHITHGHVQICAAETYDADTDNQVDLVTVLESDVLHDVNVTATLRDGGCLLILHDSEDEDAWNSCIYNVHVQQSVKERELKIYTVNVAACIKGLGALQTLENRQEAKRLVAQAATLQIFGASSPIITLQILRNAIQKGREPKSATNESSTLVDDLLTVVDRSVDNCVLSQPCARTSTGNETSEWDTPLIEANELKSSALAKIETLLPSIKSEELQVLKNPIQPIWHLMFPENYNARQTPESSSNMTVQVPVTAWRRLTPVSYSRNVFHLELDITGTDMYYNIGDALAVFGVNSSSLVELLLNHYGLKGDEALTLPHKSSEKNTKSLHQLRVITTSHLFSRILDLQGKPSKKFYQSLLEIAQEPKDQDRLALLLSDEGKALFEEHVAQSLNFVDVLKEFPSAKPSLAVLYNLIPELKPRHYSIASSRKMYPNSIHLLVVLHNWVTPSSETFPDEREVQGQCSTYLANLQPGDLVSVALCSSAMVLPQNHRAPVVMAGLGTGMAPFRAFLQERAVMKAQGYDVGPMWLFFGSRSKHQEYLYGEELERYVREGVLTTLSCAFSRDQPEKIYIQDRMRDHTKALGRLLVRNELTAFYLCGPTWPVPDVTDVLLDAIDTELREEPALMASKSAKDWIEKLKDEDRFVLEVY